MKTYTFHVSTLPRSIIDKTTAKKRWFLPKIVFLDVETTFRYTFLLATCNVCPLAIPEFFAHNMGIWLLANHSFPPSISVECNMARFHWASQVAMDTYIHRTTTGPPSVKNIIARDCTWLQTVSLFIADYPVLLVYFVTVIYKAHTWWQRKTCGTKINRFQRMLLKRHAVSRDYFFGENCPVHASDKVRWEWPRGAPGHLHNDVYSRTIFSPKKLLLSLPPEISIVNENTYELYISIKIVVLT